MEQGLLSPNGEYALGDIYKAWDLRRHWIIWRQFLMILVNHCFTLYGFYVATIHWPPQLSAEVGCLAFIVITFFTALLYALFGRKKPVTYGFLVGGISGILSTMSTDPRVVIPLGLIFFCGFYTPAIQLAPDDWYDGASWFVMTVIFTTRCLLYIGSCVVATAAPPLGWKAQATVLLGCSAAIVYASLLRHYMLQSPSEALEGCCDGLARLQPVDTVDKDKRHAVRQEKAIQALREFAEATGNTLPENLKSLKAPE
ncbi:uncharacterized protein LOC9660213 isoform X2 [Selaginella moellendorffii]|uniref:uncharacterized protein LOC9660213 isoform X2 n=1 Tax=Selaginella moellendorffii TaxID=88036 RepID=UPI000D1C621D|nr:uncharacterized protein LOC9660213 isoform X2 [Selaginella moellendorffii]|eukprot:XP_024525653.1 uncharacterized protein LOC9660213 isoform X2 [Selaginella moellendorffii]